MMNNKIIILTAAIATLALAAIASCAKKDDGTHPIPEQSAESTKSHSGYFVAYSEINSSEITFAFNQDVFMAAFEERLSYSLGHNIVAEDIAIWIEGDRPLMSVSYFDVDEEHGNVTYIHPCTDTSSNGIMFYVNSGEIGNSCIGTCNKNSQKCTGELDKLRNLIISCKCIPEENTSNEGLGPCRMTSTQRIVKEVLMTCFAKL